MTVLDIRIWVRVLIEEPPLIEQTDTSVLLHLVVLHHMTDDTAHTDVLYNMTAVHSRGFRTENVDSFAIYCALSNEWITDENTKVQIPEIRFRYYGVVVMHISATSSTYLPNQYNISYM